MKLPRSAGVLLHIASLPGPTGVGDVGGCAHRFAEFLADAGQSFWQVLPLGPSDHGNPYVALSSWAGSPLFVSLDALAEAGDLTAHEVQGAAVSQEAFVDYDAVARRRSGLLAVAARRFFERAAPADLAAFERFRNEEAFWLGDWALFAAARDHFGGRSWWTWPRDVALREPGALAGLREQLGEEVKVREYVQFRFFEQWGQLRAAAAARGVRRGGDVPIYCARDSADVWAARDRFQLDADGEPTVVSGVPPDYFSAEGQLWGTPVYDWARCRAEGYAWWIARLRGALELVDVVRIDHFRAFEAHWEVPRGAASAKSGRWVEGPGDDFFAAVRQALGKAPFIAEDLGVITAEVRSLRDRWELPGMRVLQFAFGRWGASPHLPFRHVRNCVVYTGTHDNDTALGWYENATPAEQDYFRRYTASDGTFVHWHMIRAAYASVADLVVVPMQDLLGLGSWARLNTPGVAKGNWRWKLLPGQIDPHVARMVRELAEVFGRLPGQRESD
jgi:4-alpha-glucanotransferase